MTDEIDNAIRDVTGVGGGPRVCLAADIGNVGIDDIDWRFLTADGFRTVTVPRAVFRYEREPGVNFWLVEMSEAAAEVFGIADLILSDEDAERHRRRIFNHETH